MNNKTSIRVICLPYTSASHDELGINIKFGLVRLNPKSNITKIYDFDIEDVQWDSCVVQHLCWYILNARYKHVTGSYEVMNRRPVEQGDLESITFMFSMILHSCKRFGKFRLHVWARYYYCRTSDREYSNIINRIDKKLFMMKNSALMNA